MKKNGEIKVCLVGSSGGHLTHLYMLKPFWKDKNRFWVTFDLIFKHDELRKTPILDQNGNRIMRDEFYLDGLNCEPYSFDAACQQLNREYQKNKNKNEIKSHHYIISFDPRDSTENCLTGKRAQELGLECRTFPFGKDF